MRTSKDKLAAKVFFWENPVFKCFTWSRRHNVNESTQMTTCYWL